MTGWGNNTDLKRYWTALTSDTAYFVNSSSGLRFNPSFGNFADKDFENEWAEGDIPGVRSLLVPDGDKSDLVDDIDGLMDMGGREVVDSQATQRFDYISRSSKDFQKGK